MSLSAAPSAALLRSVIASSLFPAFTLRRRALWGYSRSSG
jgi:hypothetical protein